jgi:hypothetical protein
MIMKKTLLIAVATVMVALGANAQVAKSSAKFAMPEGVALQKVAKMQDAIPEINKKSSMRRADVAIAGSYIMESNNWEADFTENSEFTMEDATGTIKAGEWNTADELEFTRDFEYNVKLTGFTYASGTAYGYFDKETSTLVVPVQVIFTNPTYGDIVMTGGKRSETGGVNYGSDIVLNLTEDGFEFDEEYATGWFSILPNYEAQPGATWNYGFDATVLAPNAIQGGVEVHIESGAWGSWTRQSHMTFVEDYGSEIVVHNFFGLCPISITIDGNKASIATPVRVDDYDYADEGEDPNYIMINQWDANFENILNPGLITGNVSVDTDGTKYIEFYDTEYREAWTDESGEHEAGNYIINDYTKWFMVHSTWGETGAYWWGEARNVYIAIPNAQGAGISDVKTNAKSTVKTYNLMGQEVNASAKGLIIRDGKKMLNK